MLEPASLEVAGRMLKPECALCSVGRDRLTALTRDNGLGVMAREAAIEIEMEFTTSKFTLHAPKIEMDYTSRVE